MKQTSYNILSDAQHGFMLRRSCLTNLMGIHLKITRWGEEFLKNMTFRVQLGGHLSSEGTVKSGVPQDTVLGPLLFLIFINDLENELTCNHLFFADDVKLIAPRSQQHELR